MATGRNPIATTCVAKAHWPGNTTPLVHIYANKDQGWPCQGTGVEYSTFKLS